MSDRVGAIINKDIEVVKGRIGSFINNFMASANGCKMPYGPTMLGPFVVVCTLRFCVLLMLGRLWRLEWGRGVLGY